MNRLAVALALAMAVLAVIAARAAAAANVDPFAFWKPSIEVTEADRRQLARGEPFARVLPSSGREIALFAAEPVRADGDRLVAWIRQIAEFKRGRYVLAINRFSDPPQLRDLADLVLDDRDVSAIQECEPGDCGLKLSGTEMARLHDAFEKGKTARAVQDSFRHIVLDRIRTYLAGGLAALPPYENTRTPVLLEARFSALVRNSPFLKAQLPRVAASLTRFPDVSLPDSESFIYWSKESFNGKPIVRATHVIIVRGTEPGLPDALVIGKEIFSTHYLNASLGITAVVRGEHDGTNYLVYLNRSEVDLVRGPLRALVRWRIEERVKEESATVLRALRERLESGDPVAR